MNETSPVLKAIGILRHVAQQEAAVTLANLSRAVGLPKPTAYHLGRILERAGLISRDPLSRRYQLGSAFDTLAFSGLRNGVSQNRRRLLMENLSQKVGERINLGVLSGGKALYVEWVESTSELRVEVKPGTKLPLHCSANGKLLLAYSPPAVRERVLASAPFPTHTGNTITTADALSPELDRIRRRGYAEDNEEFLDGVICLAVPVRNRGGHVVAGLALMAVSARLSLEKARRYLPDLLACAAALSAELLSAEERFGVETRVEERR
jgi:IclR family transcriptional regulator, acetate operon repressor